MCSFLPCLSGWLSTVFLANGDKVIDLQISIAVLNLKKKEKDCSYNFFFFKLLELQLLFVAYRSLTRINLTVSSLTDSVFVLNCLLLFL